MVLLVLPAFLPFAIFSTPNKGGRVPPGPFRNLSLSSTTAHVTLSYKKNLYCTFSPKSDEDNENRRCFCFGFDRGEQNNQAYYFNLIARSGRFVFCTTNITLCYIKVSGIPSGDKDAIPHRYTLLTALTLQRRLTHSLVVFIIMTPTE